jgi:hypothetical protein
MDMWNLKMSQATSAALFLVGKRIPGNRGSQVETKPFLVTHVGTAGAVPNNVTLLPAFAVTSVTGISVPHQ